MREALQRGGNVLVPVDTAGRALELLMLLEDFWAANADLARAHPMFLCGREVARVLELAGNNVASMKRRNRERDASGGGGGGGAASLR